jgi:hypothetical protein
MPFQHLFLNISFLKGNGATIVATVMFVLAALVASVLARFLGRVFKYRLPFSVLILLYAMAGGLLALFLHFYAVRYLSYIRDEDPDTLPLMFGMFSAFVFANMVALPILLISLRNKNRKIKELEEELRKKG